MDYRAKNRSEDGVLQMLANGSTLNNIKEKWPNFKDESCNVRLSLETDGFNPFGELHSTYSVWHVFVIKIKMKVYLPCSFFSLFPIISMYLFH